MTEPPPNFTVGFRQSRRCRSPIPRHTFIRPSLWKRQKRDSSEKTTFFHSSLHSLCSLHHLSLALTFFFDKYGFLHAEQLENPCAAMHFRTVSLHTFLPMLAFTSLVISPRAW